MRVPPLQAVGRHWWLVAPNTVGGERGGETGQLAGLQRVGGVVPSLFFKKAGGESLAVIEVF